MKKLIFSLMVLAMVCSNLYAQNVKLEVGMKAPDWVLTDADGNKFSMESWKGKVLQVNYVDPDESDLNDPLNDAIKKAKDVDNRINGDKFKGFGIVDCKSTWKPNALIRTIAGNKAKKFNTTILFDYKGELQALWNMPKDNYTVVILDKNRVCRALYKGKVAESEYEKVIQLIIKLGEE
jgi:predicted transcriptional regulator